MIEINAEKALGWNVKQALYAFLVMIGVNILMTLLVGQLFYDSWHVVTKEPDSLAHPAIKAALWGACLGNFCVVIWLFQRMYRWGYVWQDVFGRRFPSHTEILGAMIFVPLCAHGADHLFRAWLLWGGLDPAPQVLGQLLLESPINEDLIFPIIYGTLMGPVLEEVIFRGFIYTGLKKRFRPFLAMILSGVLFGIAHVSDPYAIAPIIFLGIVLSFCYEKTGSLWTPIIGHISNNAFSFWLLLGVRDQ